MSRLFKLSIDKDKLVSVVGSLPEKTDVHGILFIENIIVPMSTETNKPVKRLHIGDMFTYPLLTVADNDRLTRFKNGKLVSFQNKAGTETTVLIVEAEEALSF